MRSRIETAFRRVAKKSVYRLARPGRLLFDHVPKCGGTTVTNYLLRNYPDDVTFMTDTRKPQQSVTQFKAMPEHLRFGYALVLGHLTHELSGDVHPATVRFTVVRDPVDRVVSHYFYAKQDPQHYLHERLRTSGIELEDYASSGLTEEVRNWYTTHFSGLRLAEAEAAPEASVSRAANVLLGDYDVVGFQEDLPGTMHAVRAAVGLYRRFDNQRTRPTSGRPRFEDLPDRTKKAIADVNFLDVSLFDLLRRELKGESGR